MDKRVDHVHPGYPFATWKDFKADPTGSDRCHIYFVHQDGSVYCDSDVELKNREKGNKDDAFCGDDRLTLMYVLREAVWILVARLLTETFLDTFQT